VRLNVFRILAGCLIVYNLAGTIGTWSDHLVKAGTSHAHAIMNGTEFTGPLAYVALWCVFLGLTFFGGRVRIVGVVLMSLAAFTYSIGQITELAKSHIDGLSTHKYHVVIGLTWVGLALAVATVVTGFLYLMGYRRAGSSPAVAQPV
jgi:hypothetical protein